MREVATLSVINFVDCEHILGIFISSIVMKSKSLVGKRFSKLIVLKYAETKNESRFWSCRCDCGNKTLACSSALNSGHKKSCGCLARINLALSRITHGKSKTREYSIYCGMLARCYNRNKKIYRRYGGRGISVCKRWRHSFNNFLADMGNLPTPNHTLDRINNDGNYKPSNCRWATMAEQCKNRRTSIKITYNGETKILSDWAKLLGFNQTTLKQRIVKLHWPTKRAFTTKPKKQYRKITYQGHTKSVSAWSMKVGIPINTLRARVFQQHWPVEKALNTPVRSWHQLKPSLRQRP
jgi:hypothetical protein